MQVTEKIAAFRARMKDENFAAVIVPTADSHASEYIADYFKTRQWLSGFTGSAGTLVVGEKEAAAGRRAMRPCNGIAKRVGRFHLSRSK